jgi:LAS superfamily LD-carboxypeptidase LdcB
MLTPLELTGRATTHVELLPELGCTVHRGAAQAIVGLRRACRAASIDLVIVSSFRSFERQVQIWNGKYVGERPVLGRDGEAFDRTRGDPNALIDAILAWSALPGASRHHWGTDVDVVDGAVLASGYQPRLVPEEYAPGGVFERLGAWLDAHLAEHGFFRPYRTDRGGVQPEAWHLSYAAIAVPALEDLTLEVLIEAVAASSMHGREGVLARIPELYQRYVKGIDPPPARSTRSSTRPS